MSLTVDELRIQQAATLELRVAELMAAVRTGDAPTIDPALEALVDFSAQTPFPALQTEALAARNAASAGLADVALEELAKIADRTTEAGAGFKAAAMIAETGKAELLFPTLAATTARGLELIKQFQVAIEAVEAGVESVDGIGDVADAVDTIRGTLESLKSTLDDAGP